MTLGRRRRKAAKHRVAAGKEDRTERGGESQGEWDDDCWGVASYGWNGARLHSGFVI